MPARAESPIIHGAVEPGPGDGGRPRVEDLRFGLPVPGRLGDHPSRGRAGRGRRLADLRLLSTVRPLVTITQDQPSGPASTSASRTGRTGGSGRPRPGRALPGPRSRRSRSDSARATSRRGARPLASRVISQSKSPLGQAVFGEKVDRGRAEGGVSVDEGVVEVEHQQAHRGSSLPTPCSPGEPAWGDLIPAAPADARPRQHPRRPRRRLPRGRDRLSHRTRPARRGLRLADDPRRERPHTAAGGRAGAVRAVRRHRRPGLPRPGRGRPDHPVRPGPRGARRGQRRGLVLRDRDQRADRPAGDEDPQPVGLDRPRPTPGPISEAPGTRSSNRDLPRGLGRLVAGAWARRQRRSPTLPSRTPSARWPSASTQRWV